MSRLLVLACVLAGTALAPRAAAQCADPVPPAPSWKPSVEAAYEVFANDSGASNPWVKFTIRTCDPAEVLFQNSWNDTFHHEFATRDVPPFVGMTAAEYEAVTLHAAGQQAVLGAVLLAPLGAPRERRLDVGVQLVRRDPYPSSEAIGWIRAVRARIAGASSVVYVPTYEQRAQAEADRALFEAAGIPVVRADHWASGSACYATGWALGRLRHVPAAEIESAWVSGALLPTDILVTDEVPAEVPPVAGIAAFAPATPSSHVALLAGTWGIPFVHLALQEDRDRVLSLDGRRAVLRAKGTPDACRVRVIEVEGVVGETEIAELLALKAPAPLSYRPIEPYGALSESAEGLRPADIVHFGGKAANFGLLRRTIPDNSPVACSFSFDLWTGFLDQTLASGTTLREDIRARLAPFSWPPDMGALSAELAAIRALIRDPSRTSFTPAQQADILATLQDPRYGFDPARNLRFRSSTNVEDAEQFTGAGLYDSYSGCLADDLDADASGPSLCDPEETGERGVQRAMRRVFAGFYNDNAYLERLRHAVAEDDVGMAILVHHSYPDPFEMANGVGTWTQSGSIDDRAQLVTQDQAVSVTNPEGGAVPEVVSVYRGPAGAAWPSLVQESSLVQLGAKVMTWESDYVELHRLFSLVAAGWEAETGQSSYVLDFEYKKLRPDGRLEIKQVRPLPRPASEPVTPFLIHEPVTIGTVQGENGPMLAVHRLKSELDLGTFSGWLTPGRLDAGFLAAMTLRHADGCEALVQEGPPAAWPGFSHAYDASRDQSATTFRLPGGGNVRTLTLTLGGVPDSLPRDNPVLVPSDFTESWDVPRLQAVHSSEVTERDWMGWTTTRTDVVSLRTPLRRGPSDSMVRRSIADPAGGIVVDTSFWWPPAPTGIVAGYTAPCVAFETTVVTGLLSEPLTLTSPWSQTYLPGHHNFDEDFVLDPALDPAVPAHLLDELRALGVRGLVAEWPEGRIHVLDDAMWGNSCAPCVDTDGDGACAGGPAADCDDALSEAWATPGEVAVLRVGAGGVLSWDAVADAGATAARYDVLRSDSAAGFGSATCVESDGGDLAFVDAALPGPGSAFHYLVRCVNACPAGDGPLGTDSRGTPRSAPSCP